MKRNILITLFSINALLIIGYIVFDSLKSDNLAYVNTYEVYNEFIMKKELENKLNSTNMNKQNILDSLELNIKMKIEKIKASNSLAENKELDLMKNEYMMRKQQFEEENSKLSKLLTDQIWTQLNQYIKDFGDKNNYNMILGASGNGNILYSKEVMDVSTVLIDFVNNKYTGETN